MLEIIRSNTQTRCRTRCRCRLGNKIPDSVGPWRDQPERGGGQRQCYRRAADSEAMVPEEYKQEASPVSRD